jgi:hypothetical protein
MPAPIHRRIMRWIFDRLLWDPRSSAQQGSLGALWATRKLLIAIAGSTLLTWREWVEHHPPEILIVALIHFLFALIVIALVVFVGGWLNRGDNKSTSGQPKSP